MILQILYTFALNLKLYLELLNEELQNIFQLIIPFIKVLQISNKKIILLKYKR